MLADTHWARKKDFVHFVASNKPNSTKPKNVVKIVTRMINFHLFKIPLFSECLNAHCKIKRLHFFPRIEME